MAALSGRKYQASSHWLSWLLLAGRVANKLAFTAQPNAINLPNLALNGRMGTTCYCMPPLPASLQFAAPLSPHCQALLRLQRLRGGQSAATPEGHRRSGLTHGFCLVAEVPQLQSCHLQPARGEHLLLVEFSEPSDLENKSSLHTTDFVNPFWPYGGSERRQDSLSGPAQAQGKSWIRQQRLT